MKISQNETTNNNSTTTSATTTTISKENQHQQQQHQHQQHSQNTSQFPSQQHHQQHTVEKRKAKTLKNKILQNVAQQQRQEEEQQQQQLQRDEQNARCQNDKSHDTPSSAMTDERTKSNNNNKNSGNNNNNSVTENKSTTTAKTATSKTLVKDTERKDIAGGGNNTSDLIIAEAAKILLKNGLNGTNAAAAAAVATATATLLTAAANFHQLPPVAHNLATGNCDLTTTASISSSLSSLSHSPSIRSSSSAPDCQGLETNVTTAAAAAHAQLVAIAAAAAAVNATNHKRLASSAPCSTSSSSSLVATKTFSSSTSACKSPNQNINNGLLDNSIIQTTTTTSTKSTQSSTVVADATTTPTAHFTKPYKANCCKTTMSSDSAVDMGIIDYTVNSQSSSATATTSFSSSSSSSIINLSTSGNSSHYSTSASHNKFLANNNKGVVSSHANRSDIGRPPITHQTSNSANTQKNTLSGVGSGDNSLGGRLQFFKDGKFILELARSKDGEKGGWVSVPRKLFRTPSAATSSTVTPSATASTAAAAIPSPLAASPAAIVGGGTSSYPKNECSNSLSFSDDNSSLQSSPWQRDHCWKQTTPRKNVSKEMTLFYRRPACRKLAAQAILLSHRKRRKPYDTTTLDNSLMFELNANKRKYQQHSYDTSTLDNGIMIGVNANRQKQQQQKTHRENKSLPNKKDLETKEEVDNATIEEAENKLKGEDVRGKKSNTTEDKEQEIPDGENKNNVVKAEEQEEEKKEKCDKRCDEKNIKTEDSLKTDSDDVDMDVDMIKVSSPCKEEEKRLESAKPLEDIKRERDEFVKMNTRDCADEKEPSKQSSSLNGNVAKEEKHGNAAKSQVDRMKTGDEEQRLKKYENYKTRAKLNTIVQKLLDASTSRLAETAHSFKTSNQTTSSLTFTTTSTVSSSSASVGSSAGGSKHHNSKVSPPSNTAASRLVEYHQQHVSPRKRILREFEKVSLEDNSTAAAGGKRSRAKNNNISSSSAVSNPNATTSSSSGTSNKTMSFNAHNSNLGNIPKSNATSATSNAPTKLYSSYSIHSLLGGGVSSPPSSSPSTVLSPSSKRSTEMPATITSNTMAIFSQYHSTPFSSSSHSNSSPKSPEGGSSMGGGKSPSNSVTKSKRSPPYRSPMREAQTRSPISSGIVGFNDYGGRKSPRSIPDTAHNAFNKMRYAGSGGTDSTASPSNHHLNHHLHPQQNYHHQPQTYYSPYMMSPHYVPPLSGPSALSPNASSVNTQSSSTSTSSRSPRHHASAFRATTPTSASLTSTTHNIPSTQRGDLSPQRSTTSSPRETTPRTVPKKTASIRRQFASPTSGTQNHSSSNCSSPTTTLESRSSEDQLNNDRRTPVSANASHEQHQQPQHLMQRGMPSNSNIAGSPIHPYSYMYAHPSTSGNSPHTSNSAGSNLPSPSTANASAAAAAAAAAAASYIPAVVGSPYYHPYISTLAAMRHPQMWMQHYQSAAAAATNPALLQARHPAMLSAAAAAGAAARLSPPYHGFQYNGVGNAAALAAAAAAAGFGSTSNPSHLSSNPLSHPGSMFNPMANSTLHGMQHSAAALHAAGLVPASAATVALASATPMTDTTTDLSKSSKNNFTSSSSTSGNGGAAHSSLSSTRSSENSMYTISNKDEQSSDVPLNLSKH